MQRIIISAAVCLAALTLSNAVEAETASQREYKRGYDDCLAGRYDQDRHGASYKKGCHVSEAKGTGQPSSGVLSKDKQACLRAVRKQTNNPKVVVVSLGGFGREQFRDARRRPPTRALALLGEERHSGRGDVPDRRGQDVS